MILFLDNDEDDEYDEDDEDDDDDEDDEDEDDEDGKQCLFVLVFKKQEDIRRIKILNKLFKFMKTFFQLKIKNKLST